MGAIGWLVVGIIPVTLSLWALLDCARRPPWVWSLAGRSQVSWLAAIAFGTLLMVFGLVISVWYLLMIRPRIAAIEAGDLGQLGSDEP